MARKRKGRALNGVLLLDKPQGMTSNFALQKVRRLFGAQKAGHTGALDPLATGVLPLCFGESTKFSQFLLDSDKRYRTTYQLGAFSTTCDSDGELLDETDTSDITLEQIESELEAFRGDIEQVPPMYSALKHEGQPLYKLARQGIVIERKARPVTIYHIEILDFRPGPFAQLDLDIKCSKGTYIRTIAEDLGKALGCGAHVAKLHRSEAGPFKESQCISLGELREALGEQPPERLDAHLLPIDSPVDDLPALRLPEATAFYFMQGQPVMDAQAYRIVGEGGMVRVFEQDGDFLGLASINDDGLVAPKRLVVSKASRLA